MIKIQSNIYGLFLGVFFLLMLFAGGFQVSWYVVFSVLVVSNFKYQIIINEQKED